MGPGSDVLHNESGHRFELATADGTALAVYRLHGDIIEFFHTEVPEALQGRGIGGRLIDAALANARTRGLKVRPTCPFVRSHIERHEALADLLAD